MACLLAAISVHAASALSTADDGVVDAPSYTHFSLLYKHTASLRSRQSNSKQYPHRDVYPNTGQHGNIMDAPLGTLSGKEASNPWMPENPNHIIENRVYPVAPYDEVAPEVKAQWTHPFADPYNWRAAYYDPGEDKPNQFPQPHPDTSLKWSPLHATTTPLPRGLHVTCQAAPFGLEGPEWEHLLSVQAGSLVHEHR